MFAFIIPHCPLSVKQKAKKLYQGSLAAPSGGGAPRSPRCPLWEWCSAQPSLPPLGEVPRSGKGGAVGHFELLPFIEQHPLSLALLDSSPIGSQGPCCPLWGWCSAQRIKIVMIAGGNHTSVSCREAAKGVALVILSHYHSTNGTPSVSPYGLPAPPLGSREEHYEFARGFIKPQVPTAPLSRCGGSSALHETAVRRRGRLHPLNLSGALGGRGKL